MKEKNTRKNGFVAATIVLALGLIFIGGALVVNVVNGNNWDWSWTGNNFSGGERYENEYTQTSDLRGEDSILVDTINGLVSVTGWNEDYVSMEVSQYIRGYEEDMAQEMLEKTRPVVSSTGNRLEIVVPKIEKSRALTGYSVSIAVKVPYSVMEKADVRTSNGKIEFVNLRADVNGRTSNGNVVLRDLDGDVFVDTSNGGIDASNVKGDVEFESSNGRFTGDALEGYLKIRTSNASVEVRNSTVELDVKTSNGSVNILDNVLVGTRNIVDTSNGRITVDSVLPGNGTLELSSSNGRLTLRLPGDTAANIDADTSNGSVQIVDLPLTISKMSKTSLTGKLNGGGDLDINLRTSNSDIIVEKN